MWLTASLLVFWSLVAVGSFVGYAMLSRRERCRDDVSRAGLVGVGDGLRKFLVGYMDGVWGAVAMRRKHDLRSVGILSLLWVVALILYGMVGTSDLETSEDLTSEVDRAEVMAWGR